uniref:Uncharacterized protein n=1 Tax=Anguilla anguilla TaxID=7936 RepID=A0A0E9RG70_ANGAN
MNMHFKSQVLIKQTKKSTGIKCITKYQTVFILQLQLKHTF